MSRANTVLVLVACLLLVSATGDFARAASESSESLGIGLRGSLGTDINLGLGMGLGVNFLIPQDNRSNALEVAADFFYANSSETSAEGLHSYEEETWLSVYGVRLNLLLGYERFKEGVYVITGVGLGSVAIEWEERSDTDTSLGTTLPGGGSMQDDEGSVGVSIFNIGAGRNFSNGLEGRLEFPLLVAFSGVGGVSTVIPTVTVSLGKRF